MADSDFDKFKRAGEQTAGFLDKTVGSVNRFALTGDPRKNQDRPSLAETYQRNIGRPFESFVEGFVSPRSGSTDSGRSTAHASTTPDVSGFMKAPDSAFRGGRGHMGRRENAADVSAFLEDTATFRRAGHDPVSGNPSDFHTRANTEGVNMGSTKEGGVPNAFSRTGNPKGGPQDFMQDATDQAMTGNPDTFIDDARKEAFAKRGPVEDFMGRKEGSYANGFEVSGEWGAPGSSGMPGPGGTVNTISAEAFVNPGGKAAGDAAAGRARRDFQLRQEGNAGLASDATPEEKIEFKRQKLKQDMQNLDMGMGQSFSSLAKNKHRAKMIQQELARLDRQEQGQMAGQAAATERQHEGFQKALDRRSKERIAMIENMPGLRELKVGGTMERIRDKLVTNPEGFNGLSNEEQFLLTQKMRQDVIQDLQRTHGEATKTLVDKNMKLLLGKLRKASDGAGDEAEESATTLATIGVDDLPRVAAQKLQENKGRPVTFRNGMTLRMTEGGEIERVQ